MSFPNVDNMRARELKKYLIENLGVSAESIAKIIDRQELKQIANSYIQVFQEKQIQEQRWAMGKVVITLLLGVVVLWQIRKYWASYFGEYIYTFKTRLGMLRVAFRNNLYLASLALVGVIFLDIYNYLIQIQILLSWASLIGVNLVFFRIPMISLSMSPSQFMGRRPTADPGSVGAFINAGVNIGPMITIWIVNYVRGILQEFAAGKLLHIAQDKEARREMKRQARQYQQYQQEQMQQRSNPLDGANAEGIFS